MVEPLTAGDAANPLCGYGLLPSAAGLGIGAPCAGRTYGLAAGDIAPLEAGETVWAHPCSLRTYGNWTEACGGDRALICVTPEAGGAWRAYGSGLGRANGSDGDELLERSSRKDLSSSSSDEVVGSERGGFGRLSGVPRKVWLRSSSRKGRLAAGGR